MPLETELVQGLDKIVVALADEVVAKPPRTCEASRTVTSRPAPARSYAALRPAGPAPITTTRFRMVKILDS
jgi:hypothetical protein